jgi:hypothetical protein
LEIFVMERVYEPKHERSAPQAYLVKIPQRPLKSKLISISEAATRIATAATALTLAVKLETGRADAQPQALEIKDDPETELLVEAKRLDLGPRISKEWKKDGISWVAFQKNLLEETQDKSIKVTKTAEVMGKMGLNTELHDGSLGVTLPHPTSEPVQLEDLPSEIQDFAKQHQDQLGKPRSKAESFTDHEGHLVYVAARFENGGAQFHNGDVQMMLIGDAAKNAGIVPNEALLPEPTVDQVVVPEELSAEIQAEVETPARIEAPGPAVIQAPVSNPVGSTPNEWINYFASHTGISPSYARSIASCESSLNPSSKNSRSGASGFWQNNVKPKSQAIF